MQIFDGLVSPRDSGSSRHLDQSSDGDRRTVASDLVTRVGPRGQGPAKNRQDPGKNYWTVNVKKSKRPNGNPV